MHQLYIATLTFASISPTLNNRKLNALIIRKSFQIYFDLLPLPPRLSHFNHMSLSSPSISLPTSILFFLVHLCLFLLLAPILPLPLHTPARKSVAGNYSSYACTPNLGLLKMAIIDTDFKVDAYNWKNKRNGCNWKFYLSFGINVISKFQKKMECT